MATELAKGNVHSATEELWRVVEKDDVDQVELLLARGAHINESNESGMTALMRAAGRGRIRMVRVLLQQGADPNIVRKDGFTALMLAAFFGHQEIVRILVEHGANTDATARFGTSARMWAASRTFKGVVRYLEHPGSGCESDKVATVTNECADLPLEATSLKSAENESSVIPVIPPESLVRDADLVPRRGFLTHLQSMNRNIRVYAWTVLLFIVAVSAHVTLDWTRRVATPTAQSHPPVVIDKSAVAVSPRADSFSNSIEEKPKATSGELDKLVPENDTTTNLDKAGSSKPQNTTTRVVPVRRSDSYALTKPTTTSVSQPLTAPEPAQDLQPATQFTSATASTPKAQPAVSREPAAKRDPAPLPTQLIGGSKGTARDGKVIQWP